MLEKFYSDVIYELIGNFRLNLPVESSNPHLDYKEVFVIKRY